MTHSIPLASAMRLLGYLPPHALSDRELRAATLAFERTVGLSSGSSRDQLERRVSSILQSRGHDVVVRDDSLPAECRVIAGWVDVSEAVVAEAVRPTLGVDLRILGGAEVLERIQPTDAGEVVLSVQGHPETPLVVRLRSESEVVGVTLAMTGREAWFEWSPNERERPRPCAFELQRCLLTQKMGEGVALADVESEGDISLLCQISGLGMAVVRAHVEGARLARALRVQEAAAFALAKVPSRPTSRSSTETDGGSSEGLLEHLARMDESAIQSTLERASQDLLVPQGTEAAASEVFEACSATRTRLLLAQTIAEGSTTWSDLIERAGLNPDQLEKVSKLLFADTELDWEKLRSQLGSEEARRPAPGACGRGAGSDAGR